MLLKKIRIKKLSYRLQTILFDLYITYQDVKTHLYNIKPYKLRI